MPNCNRWETPNSNTKCCLSHITLHTWTPVIHLRADYSSNSWLSFLWWDFFPRKIVWLSQQSSVTHGTNTQVLQPSLEEEWEHVPKRPAAAGFAIPLPAHSQTTLSWLWNCTLSSCRTSWQGEHPGPSQEREKTHRRSRYRWVCSEKAAESTTVRKCFARELRLVQQCRSCYWQGVWVVFFRYPPEKHMYLSSPVPSLLQLSKL